MTYNPGWNDLVLQAVPLARRMIQTLNEGEEIYQWWQSFRDSRTDAAIATALGGTVTEADVAALSAVFDSVKECHDFANNVASPTQGDRFFQWRQFGP